ncbi:aromatic amino acid aminotransferase [Photobacterium kishitanii]|uniref:Aspartate/tyrosine/aromatic aminotransferase n=1 Tax=Photobacterium kishitanii TaxID=318456 RepID=A0AAX0Z180_9GAMM|nr:amino acid aminotransferase [Photobacterium kishitanii]KJG09491.1 aromatic amino acid aminotransferase [Photobacterium kishitanii]KJG57269.1 aromatic amino acid aminotransferase [Photobacterium kishitanii]KJG60685.1 aromatic amino acid aminotransferase [Photobacterium kishitanii]KJG64982.1 aromatic amino acid aminotransferase [Photobacterium kishitanii]KJG69058.1 aromatic amino acid aminotransferase [Photobacterium kishitanii]
MFTQLSPAQPDPILSLSLIYNSDQRDNKMDLGIGVYRNNHGQTPIMTAISQAEQRLLQTQTTKSYVGLAGSEVFNQCMIDLLLAGTSAHCRTVGVQTPGASGALRMLADLIHVANANTTVWLTDPSYVNHKPVMEAAGLKVKFYPYFDSVTKRVNTDAMLSTLAQAGSNDVVLLHGCCHNPTGADIGIEDWQAITALANKNGFMPFVDMAYLGFGDSLEQDGAGLKFMADNIEEMVIATSCSKNFGLYRERTGAALLVGNTINNAQNAKGRILTLARASYTMPPDHGAALVADILTDTALTAVWKQELTMMQQRIIGLRQRLVKTLAAKGCDQFSFIADHKGMFSMTGLSPEQIMRLRDEFAIYAVGDGRVNIAGLQEQQIDYLADALIAVTQ